MSTLITRGTRIEQALSYCSNSGQRTIEMGCVADWSDVVCTTMGWTVKPDGFLGGKLNGALLGSNVIFDPNKGTLKDYRFDIPISKVSGFKHIVHEKDGEVVKREIGFTITTVADDAAAVLDEWFKNVGPSDSSAQCKINYSEEKQETLPHTDPDTDAPAEKVRGRRKAD